MSRLRFVHYDLKTNFIKLTVAAVASLKEWQQCRHCNSDNSGATAIVATGALLNKYGTNAIALLDARTLVDVIA